MRAGEPFWQWTSFVRGFDSPAAFTEAARKGLNLPKCDLCQDFPERIELGVFVMPWFDGYRGYEVHRQRIDVEVRIECHGKRWSFNGYQAVQYLNAIFKE
jgi:hypothetical protein